MAILFLDSFDFYESADLPDRYEEVFGGTTNSTIQATEGRFGTGAYKGGREDADGIRKILPQHETTVIVGFAFRHNNTINTPAEDVILLFMTGAGTASAANTQISLVVTADQKLEIHSGDNGALMGTATVLLKEDVYYYIETKVVISTGAGSFEVRVNEETVLTQSGVNTNPTGAGHVQRISLCGSNNGEVGSRERFFDDLYIDNADFLGDIHIEALLPNAIGDATEWGPVFAAGGPFENFELVDETPPDDDNTYVLGSAVGQKDSYGFSNTTIDYNNINAIQVDFYERGEAGIGTPLVVPNLYIGGTHYEGSLGISTIETYRYRTEVITNNPNTGAAWTKSEIDDLEVGPKIKST